MTVEQFATPLALIATAANIIYSVLKARAEAKTAGARVNLDDDVRRDAMVDKLFDSFETRLAAQSTEIERLIGRVETVERQRDEAEQRGEMLTRRIADLELALNVAGVPIPAMRTHDQPR